MEFSRVVQKESLNIISCSRCCRCWLLLLKVRKGNFPFFAKLLFALLSSLCMYFHLSKLHLSVERLNGALRDNNAGDKLKTDVNAELGEIVAN